MTCPGESIARKVDALIEGTTLRLEAQRDSLDRIEHKLDAIIEAGFIECGVPSLDDLNTEEEGGIAEIVELSNVRKSFKSKRKEQQ